MANNVVSGKIVERDSGVGLPKLRVVLQDLEPATDVGHADAAGREARSDRIVGLGSCISSATGEFNFAFEDDDFRIHDPKRKRPRLRIAVFAPEEPGSAPRLLYQSAAEDVGSGRAEALVIRLPKDALVSASIAVPVDRAVAPRDATAAISRLAQVAAWQDQVRKESRRMASERVAEVREETRRIDAVVESRVVESLTGMTRTQAETSHTVYLGDSPDALVWKRANDRIDAVNGQDAVVGYVVLTQAQATELQVSRTVGRTDVPKALIEPLLFRVTGAGARPASLTRSDPLEATGLDEDTHPITLPPAPPAAPPAPPASAVVPPPAGDMPPLASEAVTALDLPRFVGRVINGMTSPGARGDSNGRPTADDVQDTISQLKIGSGPADVTAYHDYTNLQIAFDHVWKQLLDGEVVETAKALARQIHDAGGDPVGVLAGSTNPVEALRGETRVIARTTSPFDKQLPDWVHGLSIDGKGGFGDDEFPPGTGGGGGGGGGGGTWPEVHGNVGDFQNEVSDGGRPTGGGGGGGAGPSGPEGLLQELEDLLDDRYTFEVFAPGSTNFGLMTTYRQRWEPLNYQAGDLVHTVTLAPKEIRRITARRLVKRDRSVKENETNLRNRSDDSKTTMRADAEVVDKAASKTSFNHASKGGFNVGYASGDATTSFDRAADTASQETKKSFHESVLNAAMQLRSEKTWSFESKDASESEDTDYSEVSNPNDELTCTYLYYELERRYRVSEHLHRLAPVVMVAMDVPAPNRRSIDRVLLAHSWIINRVLLDDRYREPLDYLCKRMIGDELGLAQLAQGLTEIRAAVEQLKQMHRNTEAEMKATQNGLQLAIESRAAALNADSNEGFFDSAWDWTMGSGGEVDLDAARLVEDMKREAYERSVREEKDLRMRLDAETSALSSAIQSYGKAYADHKGRVMEVTGLRAHFKENVLYYMQAIWSFTFQDQIFFSLFKIKAPKLSAASTKYSLLPCENPPLSIVAAPDRIVMEVRADLTLNGVNVTVENDAVTLAEIAELDRPLGFKGNYMIFPLRQSNPLTDLMMMPYLDSELGLHDPDELGAWAPHDFAAYARNLLKLHRQAGDSETQLEELTEDLRKKYARIVSSPRRVSDEIVVPSNSLFIEALPGKHPLLEDFKLGHRYMDQEKVREEVRKLKLESLRYAARILDNSLDDPDVERKVVIAGQPSGVVVPVDP